MNLKRWSLLLFICAAFLLASCGTRQKSGALPSGGSSAPDFSLQTADGSTVELKSLRGKVVVLNFWATWCGPCRAEMPGIMQVYSRLKGEGVEIIGISLDRNGWDDVRPFLQKTTVTYPVVVGDQDLAKAYKIPDAIPYSVFIDRTGNIASTHVGFMSEAQFESELKKLL